MIRDIRQVVDHVIEHSKLRAQYPDSGGHLTGWKTWDENMQDTMLPGRLVVLVAASGGGKTAAASQLAAALAHQVPVLHSSMEDPLKSVGERYLANVGRLDVGQIRRGFDGQPIPSQLAETGDQLADLPLHVSDESGTVEELCQRALDWRRSNQHEEAVWVVDQLSRIRTSDPKSARSRSADFEGFDLPTFRPAEHDRLQWVAAFLRKFAVQHNFLVILVHQVNSTRSTSGEPVQGSVRGSQGIVHESDTVVSVHRPDMVKNPFRGPGEPWRVKNTKNEAWLCILKGREVQEVRVPISWNGPEQRWDDYNAAQTAYAAGPKPTARAVEGRKRLLKMCADFMNPSASSTAEGSDQPGTVKP